MTKRLARRLSTVVDSTALDPALRHRLRAARRTRRRAVPRRARRDARAGVPGPQPGRPDAVPSSLITSQLRAMAAAVTAIEPARGSTPSTGRRRTRRGRPGRALRHARSPPADRRRIPWPCASACRSVGSRGPADRPRRRAASAAIARARRGGRLLVDLRDGPLRADPERRPRVGGHAREHGDARLPGRRRRPPPGSARSSRASRTATSPTWPRSSPPWTCCPAGGPSAGSGTAWYRREHELYGWDVPAARRALRPLGGRAAAAAADVGQGHAAASTGARSRVPAATCYPRPLQDHVPILVGGSGERRTLRLVARYADICNLFGDPTTVAARSTCCASTASAEGRDPTT